MLEQDSKKPKRKKAASAATPAQKTPRTPKKAAATASAPKKPAAARRSKKTPVAVEPDTSVLENGAGRRSITPEERHRMIAETAYYRSLERRGSTDTVADWLAAEAEVDALLVRRRGPLDG